MNRLSSADVSARYGVTQSVIRELVREGLVNPTRGAQQEYQFEFDDVVTLRMAQSLADSRLSARKIARFLAAVRADQGPPALSRRLRVAVIGRELVVREPLFDRTESGQLLLDLSGIPVSGTIYSLDRDQGMSVPCSNPFLEALDKEETDPAAAEMGYRTALASDPEHVDAYLNLGVLLLEAGRISEAKSLYQTAVTYCPDEARLHFNFAICCQELGEFRLALGAYEKALACDPEFQEAHHNIGLLYDQLNEPNRALRHLNAYRKLASVKLVP